MKPIATLDLETDPFEYGRMIHPFTAGFYDGSNFVSYWGPDCVPRMVAYILSRDEPLTIYAHNGGRFDFFYFLKHIGHELRIVNSRIIQAHLGPHELRDSYAIMPFALETYKKTPIDYETFRPGIREQHRETILSYLRDDCIDLWDLCSTFITEFGDSLTIGSASMKQLKKFHTFATGNKEFDSKFRKDFYFGGRNQVFESGIIRDTIKVYDVNSMYPYVMRDCLHPVSTGIIVDNRITPQTAFVVTEGHNYGAFPTRLKDNSLDFTIPYGTFHTTIHEFQAAEETGAFKPTRIVKTIGFNRRECFDDFVTHFYDARRKAKDAGDKIRTIFYKYVLNSGYGKFAQNPDNYCDWYITEFHERPADFHQCTKGCSEPCLKLWSPSFISGNDYIIWSRPLAETFFYNIATGASITGAARAILLRGIRHADRPIYCDTDSIICSSLRPSTSNHRRNHDRVGSPDPTIRLHDSELGAWKLETEGTMAAICGKKLYAIFDSETCVKKAHKGARLTGSEILSIARGSTIESCNPVPSFKWDGSHTFTKRNIKKTA